jgi:hypothetical protein
MKLDALEDNVSKMSSDIDGLRASYAPPPDNTTKLTLLEGTVSRMGSEFVELRKNFRGAVRFACDWGFTNDATH